MSKKPFDAKDPLWKVLGKSTTRPASPQFAHKVVRASREEVSIPIWNRALSPLGLLGAGAGLAVIVYAASFALNPSGVTPSDVTSTAPAVEVITEDLNTELLGAAAESPSLFSDDELLALIF